MIIATIHYGNWFIKGDIVADDYEDAVANDPRVDELRNKMVVVENKQYSLDYLDPNKRSIANAVQVHFKDGTVTENVECEYPLGHRFRREAIPKLFKIHCKYGRSLF